MVYMYHSFLIHSSADGHLDWKATDFVFSKEFRFVGSCSLIVPCDTG